MARKVKYLGTFTLLYGNWLDKLIKLGYKGTHRQFRIVCKCHSMAEANRICEGYGLGSKVFLSKYTSETGNDKELELLQNTNVIIARDGINGYEYVSIDELINMEV